VHLGAFLLLRASPIVQSSPWVTAAVVALGLLTVVHATLSGRVQTDIKCALAYASLAQVGIIVVEIGLGLRWLALLHMIGHICVRTLQLLRAPSLLHDRHQLENALGAPLHSVAGQAYPASTSRLSAWLYRYALERGYLEAVLNDYVLVPLVGTFRRFDGMERRWTAFLSSRRVDRAKHSSFPSGLDEL
jgi:NAD(P)H-quinone oxidoreductase subunit 5